MNLQNEPGKEAGTAKGCAQLPGSAKVSEVTCKHPLIWESNRSSGFNQKATNQLRGRTGDTACLLPFMSSRFDIDTYSHLYMRLEGRNTTAGEQRGLMGGAQRKRKVGGMSGYAQSTWQMRMKMSLCNPAPCMEKNSWNHSREGATSGHAFYSVLIWHITFVHIYRVWSLYI